MPASKPASNQVGDRAELKRVYAAAKKLLQDYADSATVPMDPAGLKVLLLAAAKMLTDDSNGGDASALQAKLDTERALRQADKQQHSAQIEQIQGQADRFRSEMLRAKLQAEQASRGSSQQEKSGGASDLEQRLKAERAEVAMWKEKAQRASQMGKEETSRRVKELEAENNNLSAELLRECTLHIGTEEKAHDDTTVLLGAWGSELEAERASEEAASQAAKAASAEVQALALEQEELRSHLQEEHDLRTLSEEKAEAAASGIAERWRSELDVERSMRRSFEESAEQTVQAERAMASAKLKEVGAQMEQLRAQLQKSRAVSAENGVTLNGDSGNLLAELELERDARRTSEEASTSMIQAHEARAAAQLREAENLRALLQAEQAAHRASVEEANAAASSLAESWRAKLDAERHSAEAATLAVAEIKGEAANSAAAATAEIENMRANSEELHAQLASARLEARSYAEDADQLLQTEQALNSAQMDELRHELQLAHAACTEEVATCSSNLDQKWRAELDAEQAKRLACEAGAARQHEAAAAEQIENVSAELSAVREEARLKERRLQVELDAARATQASLEQAADRGLCDEQAQLVAAQNQSAAHVAQLRLELQEAGVDSSSREERWRAELDAEKAARLSWEATAAAHDRVRESSQSRKRQAVAAGLGSPEELLMRVEGFLVKVEQVLRPSGAAAP